MEPVLEGRNLSFWYSREEPPVLYECGFSLEGEQFLAVVGESGCGKTTLLRLASGLLQQQRRRDTACRFHLRGQVLFRGEVLQAPSPDFAYVPQDFSASLLSPLTAIENVLLPLSGSQAETKAAKRRRAAEWMALTGIVDVKDSRIGELSGGQRQRVAICRALVTRPRILFMDEPFANLDPTLRPEMGEVLRRLRDDPSFDLCVVLVSHDIDQACELADLILTLKPRHSVPLSRTWTGPISRASTRDVWSWVTAR